MVRAPTAICTELRWFQTISVDCADTFDQPDDTEFHLEHLLFATNNRCMNLNISERFFNSGSVFWTLARFLLVAVPPLLGVLALAWLFSSMQQEKSRQDDQDWKKSHHNSGNLPHRYSLEYAQYDLIAQYPLLCGPASHQRHLIAVPTRPLRIGRLPIKGMGHRKPRARHR